MNFWKKHEEAGEADKATSGSSASPKDSRETGSKEPVKSSEQLKSGQRGSDSDEFTNVRSALGPGTVIQGKLSFDTPVRIDGKLSGEISSTDVLIVGESGEIEAELKVKALIVFGKVKGEVEAEERIVLMPTARFEGLSRSPRLRIDEGAKFNARCEMGGLGKSKEPQKSETQIIEDDQSANPQASSVQMPKIEGAKQAKFKGKSENTTPAGPNTPR